MSPKMSLNAGQLLQCHMAYIPCGCQLLLTIYHLVILQVPHTNFERFAQRHIEGLEQRYCSTWDDTLVCFYS